MNFLCEIRPHWVGSGKGEHMELEMHRCYLPTYERLFHLERVIELPTGLYRVDGAYYYRDYATVYLRKVSGDSRTPQKYTGW